WCSVLIPFPLRQAVFRLPHTASGFLITRGTTAATRGAQPRMPTKSTMRGNVPMFTLRYPLFYLALYGAGRPGCAPPIARFAVGGIALAPLSVVRLARLQVGLCSRQSRSAARLG